ncbi:hypothetical protein [Streptomyces sp. NPDC058254]|uniref:hypothetical protein n=1 Tax=Streptomyces sp. NPDC058254 TaxID=3346406 RepID=UPI0036E9ABEB
MDVSHVEQQLQVITDVARDFERAHGLEDDLFVEVLAEISKHSTDERSRVLAGAALQVRKIEFERSCA